MSEDDGRWLRRGSDKPRHVCSTPKTGQKGDVWRCACGRRYTCLSDVTEAPNLITLEPTWVRRWWPWPR